MLYKLTKLANDYCSVRFQKLHRFTFFTVNLYCSSMTYKLKGLIFEPRRHDVTQVVYLN